MYILKRRSYIAIASYLDLQTFPEFYQYCWPWNGDFYPSMGSVLYAVWYVWSLRLHDLMTGRIFLPFWLKASVSPVLLDY